MLDVTLYNAAGETVLTFHEEDGEAVDYVSLVSNETYGPPALVAPRNGNAPTAQLHERVLFINTALVPAFDIERVQDR
jgi:hypothetical protein